MLITIYQHEKINEPMWFSKLAMVLGVPRVEVSKLEDKLYDLGLLDMKYEKVDNKWTNCYHVGEEIKYLLDSIIESSEKDGRKEQTL